MRGKGAQGFCLELRGQRSIHGLNHERGGLGVGVAVC
jgi:hypothetical protein